MNDQLLAEALKAPETDRALIAPVLPAAIALIAKGYNHRDIYQFLKDRGAKVSPSFKNFSSALSKRVKRERIAQIERASK
ncbi:MAG: hypothetical protein WAN16_03635 [Chthoniobacterales bacterium]|jgi:hypothetical protein